MLELKGDGMHVFFTAARLLKRLDADGSWEKRY